MYMFFMPSPRFTIHITSSLPFAMLAVISVHFHLLHFVNYVPYNDIIFSQTAQSLMAKPTHVHFMFTLFLQDTCFVMHYDCLPHSKKREDVCVDWFNGCHG
jgi:hypothetical protein